MKGDLTGQPSQFQPRGMLGMCEEQCLNEAQLLIGWSFFSLWTVKKKWVSGARGAGLQLMWTEREAPHEREEGMMRLIEV